MREAAASAESARFRMDSFGVLGFGVCELRRRRIIGMWKVVAYNCVDM